VTKFLDVRTDVQWLKETHLQHSIWGDEDFRSFVLMGPEGDPEGIVLFEGPKPERGTLPMAILEQRDGRWVTVRRFTWP
jgi:hypothetical protein